MGHPPGSTTRAQQRTVRLCRVEADLAQRGDETSGVRVIAVKQPIAHDDSVHRADNLSSVAHLVQVREHHLLVRHSHVGPGNA